MLRSFRLGNHCSFAEEQELLLMPAYDKSRPVLPVTAIYGANASGKSNLLDGLRFMQSAVTRSFSRWDAEGGVPRRPFRLDPAVRDEPSAFVVELIIDSVRYTYGFVVDDAAVREEWLYSYPANRKRVLFERTGAEVKFGSTVRTAKVKREVIEELTRENALVLPVAGQSRFEEVQPVYRWFARTLRFREPGRVLRLAPLHAERDLAALLEEGEGTREQVLELIRAADLGIKDVRVERRENRRTLDHYAMLAKQVETAGDPEEATRIKTRLAELEARGPEVEVRLQFSHADGGDEPFGLVDESQGTQHWIIHLPAVLRALRAGSVLVIDEIDTSLHPLLTSRLIGLFRDERINTRQAQLILTTHDTSLLGTMLDEDALPRDAVWFVEKDRSGRSSLYALSDFKPRKGENHERRYLHGSYGAVPFTAAERFAGAFGGDR
ncbi:AAA family ATPase [Saccharopolyspora sp. MS10]|uniref:AAA family ATPase n=1 Tax=Saccharopolyspora sp. MS10 TaxID=3385973 RepID=UPI0039A13691